MKVLKAKADKVGSKRKTINLAMLDQQRPRDDIMYRVTDQYENIALENTRDKRAEDQRKKNEERMQRARLRMVNQGKYKREFLQFSQNFENAKQ